MVMSTLLMVSNSVLPTFVEALVSQHCFTVYAAKVGYATLNCAEQKLRPKCDESALLLKRGTPIDMFSGVIYLAYFE